VILGVRRLAFALIGAVAATPVAAVSPTPAQVLDLLHDGRFEAARALLSADGPPRQPEELFLDSFTTYWRLVFDDENEDLRGTLERQLTATILAAESLKSPDAAGDAALWSGSGHLLIAELRASQRRSMAAAFEAKKAKRLLESAAIEGAGATDARFGLGTYNYLAATVPSYVKGLRALLFLPPGNRELGLQQLQGAAAGSRYFAFEARGLLITIYANKRERQYARAMRERDSLLAAYPDTIASSYASARLDLSLGMNEAALAQLARAEARAQKLGDVDPVVMRCVDLLRARAELAAFRPDLAAATASRAIASGKGLSPAIARDLEGVRSIAANLAKGVTWPQGNADFAELAKAHPDLPLLAVLAGYSGLRAGNGKEALDWFTRASSAGLPIEWQAGCDFRKGQAEDLLGARAEAVAIYKRVAETRGFVARDGAYYHIQTPFGPAR
jgi:hypothetical protein